MSIPASPGSSLPPVSDCAISSLSSSGEPPSSNSPELRMPISRSIQFDAPLSSTTAGLNTRVNSSSGRAILRATPSALLIAKIFGTCSPIVMWSDVVIR